MATSGEMSASALETAKDSLYDQCFRNGPDAVLTQKDLESVGVTSTLEALGEVINRLVAECLFKPVYQEGSNGAIAYAMRPRAEAAK
jgi:hypothetical protein